MFFEAVSRLAFPVAVAVGIAGGQTAVALGIAAAPLASLLVIPWAFARRSRGRAGAESAAPGDGRDALRAGAGFAGSVAIIQLAEQTLVNAAALLVDSAAVAGVVFSALLITRAPLQLFQVVQTSLLPHLATLDVTADRREFDRAIRVTVLAIAGFAGAIALGLLLVGPWAMDLLFGDLTTTAAWSRARRGRHGPAPRGRDAEPGGAGARPGDAGRGGVGDQRRGVRRLDARRRRRGRAAARRRPATPLAAGLSVRDVVLARTAAIYS